MRILVSGSHGLLGTALCEIAIQRGIEISQLKRSQVSWFNPVINAELLDGIDFLIHAAANTNVEACEEDPESCYRDNVVLTELLCAAAAKRQVPCVFISSTGVYGKHLDVAYREFDDVLPTTVHHRSKALAENIVLRTGAQNLVVRTGWLFGGEWGNPKNFVARRIEEARGAKGGSIRSNVDQCGNPSFVNDVAGRVVDLIEAQCSGVFNCVNTGVATRYEYVKAVLDSAGLCVPVIPATGPTFQRKAAVSNNESAENWKMQLLGFSRLPNWQDSLTKYVRSLVAGA